MRFLHRLAWRQVPVGLAALALALAPLSQALAAREPDSQPHFTFGARVDPAGRQLDAALEAAAKAGLTWLAVDFDWAAAWPARNRGIDAPALDAFLRTAERRGLKVLVSITHAPNWAMTASGPDPLISAAVSLVLADNYPAIRAIELFPAANTHSGWGAAPDPAAYLEVLKVASSMLSNAGRPLPLPVGGLAPADAPGDIAEADFLNQLYALDGDPWLEVVSLRPRLELTSPSGGGSAPAVQSYDRVRFTMLQRGRAESMVWVTGFEWPQDARQNAAQAAWVERAFRALNAQLYIEMAFFNHLNPPAAGNAPALVGRDGRWHPALDVLYGLLHTAGYSDRLLEIQAQSQPPP